MLPQDSIEVEVHSPAVAVVTLHGEHDLSSAPQVALALAVAAECPSTLIDISDTTFIDSSVISAILRAAGEARRREGVLEVIIAPEARSVRRALEIAGIEMLLPFRDSLLAGIASAESADALRRQREPRLGIRTVSAKIEHLQARAASSRARQAAVEAGVNVIRAVEDSGVADDREARAA